MNKLIRLRGMVVLSGALVVLSALDALAQEKATADTAAAANSSPGATLEEIVVTARRHEESLQQVPVAVTALTAKALEEQSIQNVEDLQGAVPDLQFGSDSSNGGRKGHSFALRGLHSSAVTVYSSEIVRSSQSVFDSFYDMNSVDVLKGPQGTLFGSNSTAGAIVFRPMQPTDHFEGSFQARGGNYGMYGGTLVLNSPLSSQAALRVAVDGESRDGFVERVDGGPALDSDKHYSGRASLKLTPTDWLKNLTVFEYYSFSAINAYDFPLSYTPCTVFSASIPCLYSPPFSTLFHVPPFVPAFDLQTALGPFRSAQGSSPPSRVKSLSISNISDADLGDPFGSAPGDVSLRAIFGYTHSHSSILDDSDGLPISGVSSYFDTVISSPSVELQLRGSRSDGALNWVLGVYASDKKTESTGTNSVLAPISPQNPVVSILNPRESQVAGYGQTTFKIIDRLKATLGFRWTSTKESQFEMLNAPGANGPCLLSPGVGVDITACTQNSVTTFNEPSWTAGLDYQADPHTLIYVVTRRGFNAGGFNPTPIPIYLTYKPETLTDVEVGLKRDWTLGRSLLRTNIALFDNDYSNVQRRNVAFVDVNGVQTPQSIILNAAKATIKGAELESSLALTSGFTLSVNGSYLDAGYDSFPYTDTTGATYDLKSNTLAEAPKWTAQGEILYKLRLSGGLGTLNTAINYAYQGPVIFEDINNTNPALPNYIDTANLQGGYGVWGGRIALDDIAGKPLSIAYWIRNAFDTTYYISKVNTGFLGVTSGIVGEPRTMGVEATWRF